MKQRSVNIGESAPTRFMFSRDFTNIHPVKAARRPAYGTEHRFTFLHRTANSDQPHRRTGYSASWCTANQSRAPEFHEAFKKIEHAAYQSKNEICSGISSC